MATSIDGEQGDGRRFGRDNGREVGALVAKFSHLGRPSIAAVIHVAKCALLQKSASDQACISGTDQLGSSDETRREAAIEAEVLLGHILGLSRAQLLSSLPQPLGQGILQCYAAVLDRRLRGEPVAYIVGHREFFGFDLLVDRRVLVPRPETELLVEQALAEAHRLGKPRLEIVDVGTGSGAIAISIAKHLPDSVVYATDISADALAVADQNCRRLAASVRLLLGDLLAPLPGRVDLVLANLPYVSPLGFDRLPAEIKGHEPRIALYADGDGLAVYRRLCHQLPAFLRPGGVLIVEIDPLQPAILSREIGLCLAGSQISVIADYSGHDRLVIARSSDEHC